MTDFATLGIAIDSTQAKAAAGDLDKLAAAGARAEIATSRLGQGSKAAAVGAAAMAAQAQASSRAAVSMGAGATAAAASMKALGTHTQGTALQTREMLVLMREAARGDFTRMAGSASILAGSLQTTGQSIGGVVSRLLTMVGILKVTQDAELSLAAADAAAGTASIKAAAQRAGAAIAAADTELALAQAAVRVATTSEAEAAAQAQVVLAHEAITAAAAEATIAENALGAAMAREGAAAKAAAAATVVSLGPIVGVLTGVGIAVGGIIAGFKVFQAQTRDSGEKFANSLGLTTKEMKRLRQEVGDLSSKEMQDLDNRARAFEVTWGDVMHGVAKAASDALDLSRPWQKFKADAADAFSSALSSAVTASSYIYAVWSASIDRLGPKLKYLALMFGHVYGAPEPTLPKDSATAYWDDVGKKAAGAQKQITGNLKIINDHILGARDERIKGPADAIKADRTPKKPKGDHGLADALATLDAQIKGQLALAEAYQVSDAEAIKAEAQQKAEEQAIRHKGAVGLFYEKELALAVARRAADGGKLIADIHAEAAARSVVNDLVEQGIIPVQRMGEALEEQQKKRQLMAARDVAADHGMIERTKELNAEIANLAFSQGVLNAELAKEAALRQIASNKDQLAQLKLEIELVDASNQVRAVRLAQLEAENFIRDNAIKDPAKQADVTKSYVDAAVAAVDLAKAQDLYNASLSYTADLLELMNERAQIIASALSDAFGSVGSGLSQALTALSSYAAQQAKLDQAHKAAQRAGLSDEREADKYRKASLNNQLAGTVQLIGGLKSMFKEHSTGYKAMEAAERAFAIIQAISAVKSVIAGAAKMFAQLGVWAFPAVAAMVAVMAGLGFSGGSSSQTAPTSSDDLQAAAGTGSVLGDSKAKSESIKNSLEIVAANTNKDLEYSNAMLQALKNIDLGISKMAGTVAKQIQVSGSLFDTSKLKLGTSGSGGFLGIGASSTTRSLYDLGLNLTAATVGSIITNGISGNSYQIVEKIKKKSGFFGIGGGTKTSYTTTKGQIDPEITSAIQDVITSLRDGLVEASKVIGLQGAEAILNSFQVNIGKVSFKDMTGQQIEDTLNAIFSKVGDQMAAALFPTLATMQKVGEGLFETFVRVAREYQVVDIELQSIGKTFGMVGVASLAARDNLVQLFGGMDKFVEATGAFRDTFLSEAEQIAPVQAAVIAEMQRLGLAGVTTREQFKQAVLGLDLTTQAGRDTYAALLAVAPAFDKVLDYFTTAQKAMADGLQSTADKFNGFATSLQKYRDTLFASDATKAGGYAALRAKFSATATLAASGDATALGGLETAGKDFLTAAKNNASSWLDYQRDVAMVARGVDKGIFAATATADYAELQLAALKNSVSILGSIDTNIAALTTAVTGVQTTPEQGTATPLPQPVAGAAPAPTSGGTSAPVVLDANAIALLQAIVTHNFDIKQLLKRWDDGEAMRITVDDDEPLPVRLAEFGA